LITIPPALASGAAPSTWDSPQAVPTNSATRIAEIPPFTDIIDEPQFDSQNLSAWSQPANHQWTLEEKKFLLCSKRFFNFKWAQIAAIMNCRFPTRETFKDLKCCAIWSTSRSKLEPPPEWVFIYGWEFRQPPPSVQGIIDEVLSITELAGVASRRRNVEAAQDTREAYLLRRDSRRRIRSRLLEWPSP
jgi:hypothetical protein